jgi:hypothetical protein
MLCHSRGSDRLSAENSYGLSSSLAMFATFEFPEKRKCQGNYIISLTVGSGGAAVRSGLTKKVLISLNSATTP